MTKLSFPFTEEKIQALKVGGEAARRPGEPVYPTGSNA
jgi:hypothetical protein